jgi:hypothetical protein
MRKTVFFILLVASFNAKAQLEEGVYQSIYPSFRQNYFLQVSGDSVTLYGWELKASRFDTVYFSSTTPLSGNLIFTNFSFFKKPVTPAKPVTFPPLAEKETVGSFLLHSRFLNFKKEN